MERGNYRIGSFVCENPSLDFAGVEGIVMSRNGWNIIELKYYRKKFFWKINWIIAKLRQAGLLPVRFTPRLILNDAEIPLEVINNPDRPNRDIDGTSSA